MTYFLAIVFVTVLVVLVWAVVDIVSLASNPFKHDRDRKK